MEMDSEDDLLKGVELLPERLEPAVARRLIALARSTRSEDTDLLIEVGMTRGLRHPRFAVQAIEAELGQRYAKESVALAARSVKVAQLAFWVTLLAAVAAIANVVAVVVG
jgi:hypothetical protein